MAIDRKNIVDASRRRLIEKLAAGGVTSAFAACFVTASLAPGLASAAVQRQGNSTVKLITLLHRKPGMSREDFIARYESVHSKIGEKYCDPMHITLILLIVFKMFLPTGPARNSLRREIL